MFSITLLKTHVIFDTRLHNPKTGALHTVSNAMCIIEISVKVAEAGIIWIFYLFEDIPVAQTNLLNSTCTFYDLSSNYVWYVYQYITIV